MAISFRYMKEPAKQGCIYRPKIPITLKHGTEELDVMALLDSGSDAIIIPKFLADVLKLDTRKKREVIEGVGGPVKVANARVTIIVQKKKEKYTLPNMAVKIPLGKHAWNDVLLGRIPFFQKFDITFRENARKVVLTRSHR